MSQQPGKGREIRNRQDAHSLNFPMDLPFLSYGSPLTFRSNKTIIQIIQQASTAQKVSFGIVIFNEDKA